MQNDSVESRPANAHDRCAARLTFQRHEAERLLRSRMNEQIGGTIITGELRGIRAVLNPAHAFGFGLELLELLPLRPVANNEKVKFARMPLRENSKRVEKRCRIFFRRQPANVKKEFSRRLNPRVETFGGVIGVRP